MSARDYSTRYRESQILTASREQLLLLTYDGVLRFLARARRGMQAQDRYEKHIGITRAQSLIIELRRTLDFSVAPELAHNLARLYRYLVEQLAAADTEDDDSRLEQVVELITELREAWAELARQGTANQETAG